MKSPFDAKPAPPAGAGGFNFGPPAVKSPFERALAAQAKAGAYSFGDSPAKSPFAVKPFPRPAAKSSFDFSGNNSALGGLGKGGDKEWAANGVGFGAWDVELAKEHEKRLHAFYTKVDKSKIPAIAKILTKYKGKEDTLFKSLVKKYKGGAFWSLPQPPGIPRRGWHRGRCGSGGGREGTVFEVGVCTV